LSLHQLKDIRDVQILRFHHSDTTTDYCVKSDEFLSNMPIASGFSQDLNPNYYVRAIAHRISI